MMFLRSRVNYPFSRTFSSRRLYSGLLSGFENVDAVKKSLFYTSSMDLKLTVKFLNESAYVYRQAELDASLSGKFPDTGHYLSSLKANVSGWMNKNEFYHRKLIVGSVRDILSSDGQFACLLGGKSTGKTLLFNHLVRSQNSGCIIHLNMREFPEGDILKALMSKLLNTKFERASGKSTAYALNAFDKMSKVSSAFTDEILYIKDPSPFQGSELINLLREKNITDSDIIEDLLSRLNLACGKVTLVIDEANVAFTPHSTDDHNRLKKARDDLNLLTKLTKESKQMNVILCSTDCNFPFRLRHAGFNQANFTELMYMEEVPPCGMYDLLTKEWGYGEHLAIAMMEHLGGHIWDHSNALSKLALLKERFHPSFIYDMDHSACVAEALTIFNLNDTVDFFRTFPEENKQYERDSDTVMNNLEINKMDMIKYLTSMAMNGYSIAPDSPYTDRVCEVISDNYIGSVVKKSGAMCGLSDDAWKGGNKYGLVSAKQSMRLVIAEQLVANKFDFFC